MSGFGGVTGFTTQDLSTGDACIRHILKHGTIIRNPIRMHICPRRRVKMTLDHIPERIIMKRILKQQCNIIRRTIMLRIMQPCAIHEMGVLHPNRLRLSIHLLHKVRLSPRNFICQRQTTFCPRRQNHSINKVPDSHTLPRLKSPGPNLKKLPMPQLPS